MCACYSLCDQHIFKKHEFQEKKNFLFRNGTWDTNELAWLWNLWFVCLMIQMYQHHHTKNKCYCLKTFPFLVIAFLTGKERKFGRVPKFEKYFLISTPGLKKKYIVRKYYHPTTTTTTNVIIYKSHNVRTYIPVVFFCLPACLSLFSHVHASLLKISGFLIKIKSYSQKKCRELRGRSTHGWLQVDYCLSETNA